jgi:hypothetical protein
MRFRRGSRGQTTIEYLLTTAAVLVLFSSMYGFTQGQLKKLFSAGARVILRSYY